MARHVGRIAAGLFALCAARFAIMLWASVTLSASARPAAPEPSPERPSIGIQADPDSVRRPADAPRVVSLATPPARR